MVKRKTKFRSTTHPVKVLVNELQLILGIERLRQGPSHILTRAELLPASYGPTLQRKYANADEGGDDDSKASILKSFCIGKGETWPTDGSLGSDSTASVLTRARKFVENNPDDCDGWETWMLTQDLVQVTKYSKLCHHAERGREEYTSRAYTLEKTRDSSHVCTTYISPAGEVQEHVAVLKCFVCIKPRVQEQQQQQQQPLAGAAILTRSMPQRFLRFALADFYTYKTPIQDADLGTVYRVASVNGMDRRNQGYPVGLKCLAGKLVYCDAPNGTRYLTKYMINTGL